MTIELPRPIAAYFDADRSGNAEAVAACFSVDGIVKDERRTHLGRAAVRRWKEEASSRFSYTVEPLAIDTREGRTEVEGRVSGDFSGSPVDLRYIFVLDEDCISRLEIVP